MRVGPKNPGSGEVLAYLHRLEAENKQLLADKQALEEKLAVAESDWEATEAESCRRWESIRRINGEKQALEGEIGDYKKHYSSLCDERRALRQQLERLRGAARAEAISGQQAYDRAEKAEADKQALEEELEAVKESFTAIEVTTRASRDKAEQQLHDLREAVREHRDWTQIECEDRNLAPSEHDRKLYAILRRIEGTDDG